MAKKDTKRVSINAWEKVMKEHFDTVPTVVDWYGVEVEVKRTLGVKEVLAFVEDIVGACFAPDGTFLPQAEQFAIRSGILTYYAGFAMPESIEKQYAFVMNTDAADMVQANINGIQLQNIIEAADRKIDYLCDSNALTIKAEAEKVVAEFQKLGEQMEAVFSGMSADDIQKILGSIDQLGQVSEDKIVNAYMDRRQADDAEATANIPDVPDDVVKEGAASDDKGDAV